MALKRLLLPRVTASSFGHSGVRRWTRHSLNGTLATDRAVWRRGSVAAPTPCPVRAAAHRSPARSPRSSRVLPCPDS
ncbi:hypothetical protein EJ357_01800 [Streptomyces cyaneochromogenes]|uniref:Uncharacterized protein n=1 Tax=Streptomyces cyaneochromogenes TaxID=2496836 RepID=A0A3S9LZG1_9ACTN|nr:hypothetical protein EJ357_01800 [Streptomyces cyaneochromogenes]